jgi:hypothetical protein
MALGFGADLVDRRPVRLGRLGGPTKTAEQVGADGGQQRTPLAPPFGSPIQTIVQHLSGAKICLVSAYPGLRS